MDERHDEPDSPPSAGGHEPGEASDQEDEAGPIRDGSRNVTKRVPGERAEDE